MIYKRSSFFALLLSTLAGFGAQGATVSWTNTSGGAWSVPANWDAHHAPGPLDSAVIAATGTYTVTVDIAVSVAHLTLGGGAGQQTLTNNSQTFALTNGLVAAGGIFNVGGGALNGTSLTNQGIVSLSGVTVAIPVTVGAAGVLNFTGSTVSLNSPVTNAGTINWSGGNLSLANNNTTVTGAIYNQAGGIFAIQSDQNLSSQGYGFELFKNAGTVRKTAGVGATSFNLVFTNTGTVDAESGTIQFQSGGNVGGTYNTASGAVIQFTGGNYTETGTVTVTGSGLCRLNGASVTLNDRITKFVLANGNVALSPAFEGTGSIQSLQLDGATLTGTNRVTGTLGMNGGGLAAASPLTVVSGGVLNFNGAAVNINSPLTNAGTINWTGGNLSLANNNSTVTGAIYNQSGGLFAIENDQSVSSQGYGFELFNNAGTVRKTAGLGTTSMNLAFTNSGTVDVQSGTIQFQGGGNIGGTYNTASDAIIQFTGGNYSATGTPTITGSGLCRENGATVTLLDQIPDFSLTSGNVVLAPTFQTDGTIHHLQLDGVILTGTNRVTGTLGMNGGGLASASALTVISGGVLNFNGAAVGINSPLTNFGTINWTGGILSLANNNTSVTGSIYNQPGGLFAIQNDQTVSSQGYGFELFNNAGIVRKTAGLGTTVMSLTFTNIGTVDVQSGAIQFQTGGNIGGAYNTASGATIQFAGGNYIETGIPTITGSGLCRQYGANVTLNDRITNFSLANGNVVLSPSFQGAGTIQNLQLDGALLTGTNLVTGTLGMNGGTIASASPLTVTPGGVLNFNGAAVGINSPLTNFGTINWTGAGTLSVANNASTVTGAIYNQAGGVFAIQNDQGITSQGYGFELFNNAGTIRKTAGLGTTSISVAFVNTGTLDVQSGTFRIAGPYTQTGGTMNFGIISPADFGQLAFNTSAPLTGALSINFKNGYTPSPGDSFALVSYGSRAGVFTSLSLPSQAQWQTNYTATAFVLSVLSVSGSAPITLTPESLIAGGFTMQINGTPGLEYIVQASSDLLTWTPILTNTPSVTPFTVTDINAHSFPHRFYRAHLGP